MTSDFGIDLSHPLGHAALVLDDGWWQIAVGLCAYSCQAECHHGPC